MTDIVAAADVSTLNTNVTAILVIMMGIAVGFVAFKYIKRAMSK
jgi:hypothetical protein